ncbi:SSI family serine proteinase inhibitor [Actinotalea sp.]|uniref:SSI family serine proteinase inhibitor n=1 Tax=Actinotalea sp. TaxID=1872145 RepID=UPI0035658CD2
MTRWSRATAAATLVLVWGLVACGTADTGAGGSPTVSLTPPTAVPSSPGPSLEPTSAPSASAPVPSSTATGLPGPSPSAPDVAAATSLTVVLDETGTGPTTTTTLTCDPLGGTHPDAAAACAAIEAAGGASAFDPVPPRTACTEQYGGPQTATVRGTVDGTPVNADFDRTNGCEISRWDRLAVLLGSAGGV